MHKQAEASTRTQKVYRSLTAKHFPLASPECLELLDLIWAFIYHFCNLKKGGFPKGVDI